MKRFILSLSIVAFFVSCSSNPDALQKQNLSSAKVVEDTVGLAAYKQWKEKQEFADPELIAPQDIVTEAVTEAPQPAPVVIYRTAPVKQQSVAKATKATTVKKKPSVPKPTPAPEPVNNPTTTENSTAGTGTTIGTGTTNDEVAQAPAELPKAKKEGWSKAAQGTAIGAGSGAVLGAIISKNKTKGAAIGGVIGAAGGYILGRKKDKADGRY